MSKKYNKIDLYYIVAFLFFVIGITGYFLGKGFLYNLSSNLITIGITVFVVQFFKDRADEKKRQDKEKSLAFKRLRSAAHIRAINALETIRENGWHKDGSFNGVDLSGCNLECANFTDFTLERVDFSKANLKNANFTDTRLYYSVLKGANLSGAIISVKNFYRTIIDGSTIFPDKFVVPTNRVYIE